MRCRNVLPCLFLLASLAACQDRKPSTTGAAPSASAVTPTLVAPAVIKAGQPMAITWTGPNGPEDYIDVVAPGRAMQVGDEMAYVKTAAGNPAKLTAPANPGTYDVRYVRDTGNRAVVAHIAISVVK